MLDRLLVFGCWGPEAQRRVVSSLDLALSCLYTVLLCCVALCCVVLLFVVVAIVLLLLLLLLLLFVAV